MTRSRAIRAVATAALVAAIAVALLLRSSDVLPPVSRQALANAGSCVFPIEDGVELTDGDRCVIDLIGRRCGNLDSCFADCFTSGRGVNVGGGCGHICNYGWSQEWHLPVGSRACYAKDDTSYLP